MKDAVREWIRANPVKVRAAVAALLVAVAQFVPQVKDLAGSDMAVDLLSSVIVAGLGADAIRKVK
ncbi:hypothetical protein E0L36_26680 [Streptomyces sp. AJS327]|uniref:hypothetical protein n=1 Tax=Streptomyces sp. AJS327 TaxID=2545265 RepID=UPI0015DDCD85|nr:hypothetical protein [Streptomyces sp. AJS327]MBA0054306.1 hypothetical protein [Streptomyces sp. AJS327]